MRVTIHQLQDIDATFTAPPSKSYTHRALIAGSLASGSSSIHCPLYADDTLITLKALKLLGIRIEKAHDTITIEGSDGILDCGRTTEIDMSDSGSSMRFLTSVALLCSSPVLLHGSTRLHERPIGPLVSGLNALGGDISYVKREGFPPIEVKGHFRGGTASIDSRQSSQYISSILLAAPYAASDTTLTAPYPPVSQSYIDVTVDVMRHFGASLQSYENRVFTVKSGVHYRGTEYTIEGDYSSASYFFAIAAVCGGRTTVYSLNRATCQGDRVFLDALRAMGCSVSMNSDAIAIERQSPLSGIVINMSSSPDTVQTLSVVAAFATTSTTITGIEHLRVKESNRIQAMADILSSLGAHIEVRKNAIIISPGKLHGGHIDPRNDHRTAMSLAVFGFGVGNLTIDNAECVDKSNPTFWIELERSGLM